MCEIEEDFVGTHRDKLCVMHRSRVLRVYMTNGLNKDIMVRGSPEWYSNCIL